jgi:hypothetical protein
MVVMFEADRTGSRWRNPQMCVVFSEVYLFYGALNHLQSASESVRRDLSGARPMLKGLRALHAAGSDKHHQNAADQVHIPSSSSSPANSPYWSGERLRLIPRGLGSMEDGGSTAVTHSRSTLVIAIMQRPDNCWGTLGLSTCI